MSMNELASVQTITFSRGLTPVIVSENKSGLSTQEIYCFLTRLKIIIKVRNSTY